MRCEHEISEMDTAAVFDGLCPICLKERVEAKDAEIERLQAALEAIAADDPSGKWGRWAREALRFGEQSTTGGATRD